MTYEELKKDVEDYAAALETDLESYVSAAESIVESEQRLLDARFALLKHEIKNGL